MAHTRAVKGAETKKPAVASNENLSRARGKDSSRALIVAMGVIIVALIACLMFEHQAYEQVKRHDDTQSADDLNGQTPANTTAPATASTSAPAAAPAANAPATTNASPANASPSAATPPASGNAATANAPSLNAPAAQKSSNSSDTQH